MLGMTPVSVKALKRLEGLRLETYTDSVGINTIGYGHTSSKHAFAGNKITKAKAEELLEEDIKEAARAVDSYVTVPLSQDQRSALIMLTFNIGVPNFRKSTLLKLLNKGDYNGAADQFLVWRKAGGRVLQGLVNRRAEERAMFLSGMETQTTEDELESNIEADPPLKPPVTSSKPIQALGATGVAATLAEASEMAAPVAEYSTYLRILYILLVVAGIAYFIYSRKEE